jgi:hypothetical protein
MDPVNFAKPESYSNPGADVTKPSVPAQRCSTWVVVAAAGIGLVGGWILSTGPSWGEKIRFHDLLDIATAVGTLGAVMVALGLALQEARLRRKDAATRAKFVAQSIHETVRRVRTFFAVFDEHCQGKAEDQQPSKEETEFMIDVFENFLESFRRAELIALATTANQAGTRLAWAVGVIEHMTYICRMPPAHLWTWKQFSAHSCALVPALEIVLDTFENRLEKIDP